MYDVFTAKNLFISCMSLQVILAVLLLLVFDSVSIVILSAVVKPSIKIVEFCLEFFIPTSATLPVPCRLIVESCVLESFTIKLVRLFVVWTLSVFYSVFSSTITFLNLLLPFIVIAVNCVVFCT